jgi:hypothetical protein
LIGVMGGDFLTSLVMFVATKSANFMCFTSLVLLVKYRIARKAQIKPPADKLKTDEGRKWWEDPRPPLLPCLSQKDPRCKLWNEFMGAEKTVDHLPLEPYDYDIVVRMSLCCCCCSGFEQVLYESKAKNPWPDVENQAAAPQASVLPEQLKIQSQPAGGGGAPAGVAAATAWLGGAAAATAVAGAVAVTAITGTTAAATGVGQAETGGATASQDLPQHTPLPGEAPPDLHQEPQPQVLEAGAGVGTDMDAVAAAAVQDASAAVQEAAALAAKGFRYGADMLGGVGDLLGAAGNTQK